MDGQMSSTLTDRLNGVNGGASQKVPTDCATTENITLSGEQTIDGVETLSSSVLVKDQTIESENGIYTSSTGSWARRPDADGVRDLVKGTEVYVTDGTINGNTLWSLRADSNPINVGVTNVTFENFTSILTSGLLPVTLSSVASGDIVRYNGSEWVNTNFLSLDSTYTGNITHTGDVSISGSLSASGAVRIGESGELTISSGEITVSAANHTVDTQDNASSDDLHTINGGSDGSVVVLRAESSDRSVNMVHGIGNILIPSGQNLLISNERVCIPLIYISTLSKWVVMSEPRTENIVLAWVNFDGTGTPSIRDSYNVSGITDDGVGLYTINFENPLPNSNYSVLGTGSNNSSAGCDMFTLVGSPPTISSLSVAFANGDSSLPLDVTYASVVVVGSNR